MSDFSECKALFSKFGIPFTIEKAGNIVSLKIECTDDNRLVFVFNISKGEYMHTTFVSDDNLVKRVARLEQKIAALEEARP